jgi:hypothetical protein
MEEENLVLGIVKISHLYGNDCLGFSIRCDIFTIPRTKFSSSIQNVLFN